MRKKLFTFFLALVTSVGMSWATENAKLPGKFSVSASQVVYFSRGNLQASTTDLGANWTWAFAENQYDCVAANASNTAVSGNGTVSVNGTVDLFGWSTAATQYGIQNKPFNSAYSGDFVDWGSNSALTAALGTGWRTLTSDEWTYLLDTRTTTSGVLYAKAEITDKTYPGTTTTIKGLIILPDDWETSYHALASTNTADAAFTSNQITSTVWENELEAHGAVFMPAAGYRISKIIYSYSDRGYYWSATPNGADNAYELIFWGDNVYPANSGRRFDGHSVRLVSETAPSGGSTPAPTTSGSCGDNLTWEFNTETGALTISGTGAMNNYSWDPNAAPWYEYKDAITSVSFPEGITTIGAYAFVNCDNAAFTTVTIPEGVTALGVNAFYNCDGIQEITIPSTVTTIEVGAIYDCKAVNSITSYIASPTNLHGYAIYGYKNTCTLYVPYNSIADYQAADCWNNIPNIAAIPGTEPASQPTVYNSGSVALSNLNVGDILMAGVTLTTEDNSNLIKFAANRVAFNGNKYETDICFPFSQITPLLGENATISYGSGDPVPVIPINEVGDAGNAWEVTEVNTGDTPVTLTGITYSGTTPATSDEHITPYVDPQDASVYYSTFFDRLVKYELPAGVEAYVADLSDANLLLTKIAEAGEVIPANVAVILKSTVTPITLTVSDADAVTFTASNDLQGSDTQIATPANCYVLAGTDGVVGFYHYTAALLNAHKAYVVYSGSNQAPRRMPFIFDQATGVENVQNSDIRSQKVVENGQLIIIRNGVRYNAAGQNVK